MEGIWGMTTQEMAARIAGRLIEISGFTVSVTAEEILAKCESREEVNWWYRVLDR